MSLTLDQINALRIVKGEETLTELPSEGSNNPDGKIEGELPEEKKEEKKTTSEPATSESTEKKEKIEAPTKKEEVPDNIPADLDDSIVLEALKKRGFDITSFEDLKPKQAVDEEKLAQEREIAKLSFGLTSGLFSKKEYDSYIKDSNDPKNVVYAEYFEEAKKENSELTNEEIQENFLAEYGLDADPTSSKYKRGLNRLALVADKTLRAKYGKIYDVDTAFGQHESKQKSEKEYRDKVLSNAPLYKRDVEEVLGSLNKVIVPFSAEESIEAEFKKEAVDKVREKLLNASNSQDYLANGWDKENLKAVAHSILINENLSEIIKDVAEKFLNKKQAGSRGVLLDTKIESKKVPVLTENQEAAFDAVFPNRHAPTN